MNDSLESLPVAEDGLTSVVVVTANSGLGVSACIERVLRSTAKVEVIVVDNASRDGSVDALVARFSDRSAVRILYNQSNLGFGQACNRGAMDAHGDIVLLLNPDCMIELDTIARLRAVIRSGKDVGLVGVLQLDTRGCVDPASRRRDPQLRRALLSVSGFSRLASRWPWFAGVEMPMSDGSPCVESVDAVSGALMAMPRAIFSGIGGFDEGYFLHCEDLDLCRRVRDAGFRVVCDGTISVNHAKGGSSRQRPVFVAWHKHRGMWRWFTKFDPAARSGWMRVIVWCGIWATFAAKLPLLLLRRGHSKN